MGLFKSIRRVAGTVLAAGHQVTAPIARLAPKALGIKSAGGRSLVDVTQKTMLAAGAAAVVGGAAKSILPSGPTGSAAVTPFTPGMVNATQEAFQERLIQHVLKG